MTKQLYTLIDGVWEEVGGPPGSGTGTGTTSSGTISVLDYGATGDGVTDDSAAIRAALATGKSIQFPRNGTFLVSEDGTQHCALKMVTPGQGLFSDGATLKLKAGQADGCSLIYVLAADVTIKGLILDGNRDNQSFIANFQRHGILVAAARCTIDSCTIINPQGDGVLLYSGSNDIIITNNRMRNCSRDGISFSPGGAFTSMARVLIANNDIECDAQCIDSEPDADGPITDVRIIGNNLKTLLASEYAMVIGSQTNSQRNARWVVEGNTMIGRVYILWAEDLLLRGNTIDARAVTTGSFIGGITAEYGSARISIIDNIIKTAGVVPGIRTEQILSQTMTGWVIRGNTINTADGTGIRMSGITEVDIANNTITGAPSTRYGIYCESSEAVQRISITDNTFTGFGTGMYLATLGVQTFGLVQITDNRMRAVGEGIYLAGTASQFLEVPWIANNDASSSLKLSSVVPWIKTGGGGVYSYEGTGTPEGVLTAPVGATAIDRNGGDGVALYVKQTGTGNTGWVATSGNVGGLVPSTATTILSGTAVPATDLGFQGYYYVDTDSNTMYGPKSAGTPAVGAAETFLTGTALEQGTAEFNDWSFGLRFRVLTSGRVTAIRWQRAPSSTQTSRTLRLWSDSGTKLAEVVTTGETATPTGFRTATLSTPVTLQAGKYYRLGLGVEDGKYVAYTDSQPTTTNPHFTSLAGYYNQNALGGFPNETFARNYFIDVVFEPDVEIGTWPTAITGGSGGGGSLTNDSVTNAFLANMPTNTIKGNNTGATADPIDLTVAQTKTLLALDQVTNTTDAGKPVSTAQQTALNLKADLVQTVNAQTGTTYAPVLTDSGKLVTLSNASAITVTMPSDGTVALPVGARIDFIGIGAGKATFAAGSGATVNGTPSLVTRAQWSAASAIKISANTWVIVGDLT